IENISQISKIIVNVNNYLKYLTLEVNESYLHYHNNNDENQLKTSSMILKDLSKSLPHSLYYLDLELMIDPDDLQIAFENCKQIELKRLLIRNGRKNNEDTTLEVIKNFAKEKNIEFL